MKGIGYACDWELGSLSGGPSPGTTVSQRTRWWDLWLHFCREMYLKLLLTPCKVDSEEERADIFTKAMTKASDDYFKFRNDLMNIGAADLARIRGE